MKIAILSPPWIALPPIGYGGTERVVFELTEGLVKKGHQVTLFATGDTKTSARLKYYYKNALGNDWNKKQSQYLALYHIHNFISLVKKEKFDIIHNHFFYLTLFFLDFINTPFLTTLHGPLYSQVKDLGRADDQNIEEKRNILLYFKNYPFVSISNHQRKGLPQLNYIKTIYNGVKVDKIKFSQKKGKYLAWLGRITPKKGVDLAIKVALKLNLPLKISGYIDPLDQQFFDEKIKPLIEKNSSTITFLGEFKDEEKKNQFLGDALLTLFPLRWHEPFGIVMIESLATGTPVVAFTQGSAPEVIKDGETGFIVNPSDDDIRGN